MMTFLEIRVVHDHFGNRVNATVKRPGRKPRHYEWLRQENVDRLLKFVDSPTVEIDGGQVTIFQSIR